MTHLKHLNSSTITKLLTDILNTYSAIIFQKSPLLGASIALGTFFFPNIGISGLLCLLLCFFAYRQLSALPSSSLQGVILLNGLLTGLFTGYFFVLSGKVLVFIGVTSVFLVLLCTLIEAKLKSAYLPVLSLPFTFTGMMIAFSKSRFSAFADASIYWSSHASLGVPWLDEFFKALGSIYCIPHPVFGAWIFIAVALTSYLNASFLMVGFFLGYAAEGFVYFSSSSAQYSHLFNYSLVFPAVAAVFFVPSLTSLSFATIACLVASFVALASLSFFHFFQIPVGALPFNGVVLLMIQAVRILLPRALSFEEAANPEEKLERSRFHQLRYRSGELGLFCPFTGKWFVQQGFAGKWTHRGVWQNAVDFVQLSSEGKSFQNQGFELEDYSCFGQPVLSPIEGTIVGLQADLPDNPIGKVDNQQNWGNYLIIQSQLGFYVVLAHLKQNSIQVKIGEFIPVGKKLAECGNSGYSVEPHLHLQVQWSAHIGAPTAPFHLLNYQTSQGFVFHGVPQEGEVIEPGIMNRALDRIMTFRIGDELKFAARKLNDPSESSREVTFRLCLDEESGAVFLSERKNRLFFHRLGVQFYFYGYEGEARSALADLYLSLPRIPMILGEPDHPVHYNDILPLKLTHHFFGRLFKLGSFLLGGKQVKSCQYHLDPALLEITGTILCRGSATSSHLKIDPSLGIEAYRVGDRYYARAE